MINTSGGGFHFSVESIGGTWTWTISANNIQGLGQLYQMVNICTPYGRFTEVDIPIPGDVLSSMNDSLSQFQQQLAPLVALTTAQTVYYLNITEGDPASIAANIGIINIGSFGSFLDATATSSVPWLEATPSTVTGIGKNQKSNFVIKINPSLLFASSSPYSGVISIQDNRSMTTIIPVVFNINVIDKPYMTLSSNSINLVYYYNTNTAGPSQILTITNSGDPGSSLDFQISKECFTSSSWLGISPSSGGPVSSGQSLDVMFFIGGLVNMLPGNYEETVRIFSPNASNAPLDVQVILSIVV